MRFSACTYLWWVPLLAGCTSTGLEFPDAALPDSAITDGTDASEPADLGTSDLAAMDLTDPADGGSPVDLEALPDLATPPDLTPSAGPIAQGTFEGRANHAGQGGATLYRKSDGTIELQFGSDFSCSPVPDPWVVLTTRETMGNTMDPTAGDTILGKPTAFSGAQSFTIPPEATGKRYAFVFCNLAHVEVARAPLIDLP